MVYKRNDGTDEINAIQNRFTAYLHHAVHNGRIDYLYKKNHPARLETPLENFEALSTQSDFSLYLAERDVLQRALRAIKDRERYVLLARVIDEKDFEQIGAEVGLSYKGAAAVYYRTIAKLRKLIGENINGF